jgi:hypothetical protein
MPQYTECTDHILEKSVSDTGSVHQEVDRGLELTTLAV